MPGSRGGAARRPAALTPPPTGPTRRQAQGTGAPRHHSDHHPRTTAAAWRGENVGPLPDQGRDGRRHGASSAARRGDTSLNRTRHEPTAVPAGLNVLASTPSPVGRTVGLTGRQRLPTGLREAPRRDRLSRAATRHPASASTTANGRDVRGES